MREGLFNSLGKSLDYSGWGGRVGKRNYPNSESRESKVYSWDSVWHLKSHSESLRWSSWARPQQESLWSGDWSGEAGQLPDWLLPSQPSATQTPDDKKETKHKLIFQLTQVSYMYYIHKRSNLGSPGGGRSTKNPPPIYYPPNLTEIIGL